MEEGTQEFSTDEIEAFSLEEIPVEEELAQPLQAVEKLELQLDPPVAAEMPMPERGEEALPEPPAATELVVPEFIAPASAESVAVEPVVPETRLISEQSVAPEPFAGIEEEPKKRGFFWLWLFGVILLLVNLVVQGLYFYRSDLAANHPEIKPLLQQLCGVLECSIRLPANPDLLSIETSNLEADPQQANRVALNAILRNRAKLAQEYPQLELILTDTQDKMIARRIFTPGEYAKGADLGRGMAPNEEVTVKLNLDLGDLKAAGYRVLLFYPQ
jgi:hypothetical protein